MVRRCQRPYVLSARGGRCHLVPFLFQLTHTKLLKFQAALM